MSHSFQIGYQRRRRGSFIVESVVAIALLATAFVALGKLAASASLISKKANQRLAVSLAAENAIERLQAVPVSKLESEAPQVAQAIEDTYSYDVTITTQQFQAADRDAMHLIVTVQSGDGVSLMLHDWRIAPSLESRELLDSQEAGNE